MLLRKTETEMTKNDEQLLLGTPSAPGVGSSPYLGGADDFYGYDSALLACQDHFLHVRAEGLPRAVALAATAEFARFEGWAVPSEANIARAELEAPFGWDRTDGEPATAEQLTAALRAQVDQCLDDDELSVELPDSIPAMPEVF